MGSSIIKQRHSGDCGIAATAMYLNMTYEACQNAFQEITKRDPPFDGVNDLEIAKVLKTLDFDPVLLVGCFLSNVEAIYSVPSVGRPKGFHYIHYDGDNINDPARTVVYTNDDIKKGLSVSTGIVDRLDLQHEGFSDLPSHYIVHFQWGEA